MSDAEGHKREYDEKHKGFILAKFAKHDLLKSLRGMNDDKFDEWLEKQIKREPDSIDSVIGEMEWQRRLTLAQVNATTEAAGRQVEAAIRASDAQLRGTIDSAKIGAVSVIAASVIGGIVGGTITTVLTYLLDSQMLK